MGNRVSKFDVDKLSNCVDIFPGFAFKSDRFTDDPADVALVKGENVQQGFVDWSASKYWPVTDANSYKRYELRVGDIVLAMDRPWVSAGLKWAYIKKHDPRSLLVQRVSRLRAKNGLNQAYLRCVISSSYFSDYIQPIVTGVNVPHISGKQIGDFKIPLPPLPIQKKIAAILSAYDDLIENNQRRIALLEKMTEEIYREWFVRMRFPGHEKVKIIKGAPEGWEVRWVADLVDRKRFGQIYRESELLPEGTVIVIDQSTKEWLGFHEGKAEHQASPDRPLILFGDHSCKMQLMIEPFSLAENVIPFTSKGEMPIIFLYYLVHSLVETTEYKRHWTDLITKQVFVPTSSLQMQFDERVRNLIVMVRSLRAINAKLSKTRDMLLPRIISGKLSVEHLDIRFPPGMEDHP